MQLWVNKWRAADAAVDALHSAKDFNQSVVDREKRAKEHFERMRTDGVPNGIQSCISRGGRILGLTLESEFLGTLALSEFLTWCDQQDLHVAIEVESRDEVLLLFSPKE